MRECELCKRRASMYCESDQAILCWDCDGEVHGANFLVAKHTRCLLCKVCQSATPWKASGSKLCPTVSVCEGCFENHGKKEENFGQEESDQGGSDDEDEQDIDDDYDDDGDEDEDEEEDGDNQVVPWSCPYSPPSPLVASTSSSDGENAPTLKRMRRADDFDSDDDGGCSSTLNEKGDEGVAWIFQRRSKQARLAGYGAQISTKVEDETHPTP